MFRAIDRSRVTEQHLCRLVLSAGLLVAGLILIVFTHDLYFVNDSWDFLLHRGTIDGADRGLLAPHNGHWTTVPILVFRGMFAIFGLDHYLPYVLLAIVTHLALCAIAYAVLTALGSPRWPALLAVLALAFFGGGYENTMWEFQITLTGPILLGLASILVRHRWPDGLWSLAVVNVLLVLGLMTSGTGIGAVVLVCTYTLLTQGLRACVAVGAVPTAVFGCWYVAIGSSAASLVTDPWALLDIPAYVWTGLTSGLERATGIPGSGAVALVAILAAPLVARDLTGQLRAFSCAGIVALIAQFSVNGLGRVELGINQANSSRYAYLVLALLLPAIAVALDAIARSIRTPARVNVLLIGVLGAFYLVHGMAAQHAFRVVRLPMTYDYPQRLSVIQTATAAGSAVLTPAPFPPDNLDLTVDVISTPQGRALFPAAPATPQTLLDGESIISVGVATTSFGLPPAPAVESRPGSAEDEILPGGCQVLVVPPGGVTLAFESSSEGAEIVVTSPSSVVTTTLERGGLQSLPTYHTLTPDSAVVVGVHAEDATVQALFNASGIYTVCAADGALR